MRSIEEFTGEVYKRAEVKKQIIKRRNKIIKSAAISCCSVFIVFTLGLMALPKHKLSNFSNISQDLTCTEDVEQNENYFTAETTEGCSDFQAEILPVTFKKENLNDLNGSTAVIKNSGELFNYFNAFNAEYAGEIKEYYGDDFFKNSFLTVVFTDNAVMGDNLIIDQNFDRDVMKIDVKNGSKNKDGYVFVVLEYNSSEYSFNSAVFNFTR